MFNQLRWTLRESQVTIMSICIEIVVLNDQRIFKCLDSLRQQRQKPDRILIADGGSDDEFLEKIRSEFSDLPIDIQDLPGLTVETRYKALNHLKEDITVFLDSDQYAPPEWLSLITEPFSEDDHKLAYAGGPTKPYKDPSSSIELYLALIEDQIYGDDISKSLTYIPLGNTSWRTNVLLDLGFDKRLKFEAEDNDLETRAYNAGYHGKFIPEAWVWHDKTIDRSFFKMMRKRYRYMVGAATVFLKNGTMRSRRREHRNVLRHSFAVVELILKPLAFLHALIRWNMVIKNFKERD